MRHNMISAISSQTIMPRHMTAAHVIDGFQVGEAGFAGAFRMFSMTSDITLL